MLIDYLGALDSPYTKAVTRKTLVAAVARIINPGTKYDSILVLNGRQSIGKSTLFSRLGQSWYSDSLPISDMKDKTAAEKLQGIDLRIDSKLEQIQSLRDLLIKAGAILSDTPEVKRARNVHRMEDVVMKMMDLESSINADMLELVDTKREITTVIKCVENPELQTLLELRYFSSSSGRRLPLRQTGAFDRSITCMVRLSKKWKEYAITKTLQLFALI